MSDRTCQGPDGRTVTYPEQFEACTVPVLANEYLVPHRGIIPDEPEVKTVLDLGAGVGAFSLWALARWPGCSVTSVEPDPTLAGYLRRNVPEVTLLEAAVALKPRVTLHRGPNGHYGYNTIEPELTGNPSESSVEVAGVGPETLPPADVIKLDIEGAEDYALARWPHLRGAWWVVLEWHTRELRRSCDWMLHHAGLHLVAGRVLDMAAGLEVWSRTKARVNRGAWKYEL